MKTGKPSAPTIGRRLRRTLGALLAIGFATTWWKLVPPHESTAAAAPPPTTEVTSEPQVRVVVIAIPVVFPFALPTAPTAKPPTAKPVQARRRPRHIVQPQIAIVDPPVHQPFALPPPPEVPDPPVTANDPPPPLVDLEPRIRTRSS